MTVFFCRDGANNERETCPSLEEALALGAENIRYYRREANLDGEWPMGTDDIEVGLVAESGNEDDDIVTHRATFFGNDEEGYDCRMEAVSREADLTERSVSAGVCP